MPRLDSRGRAGKRPGPRATGKTTWLRQRFSTARSYNLLNAGELARLARDPETLRREVGALPARSWVVVDEVQRLPALLDVVHELLTDPAGPRFALTGSSARKLRAGQANLLAGRALSRRFFPLVAEELDFEVETEDLLRFGGLPLVRAAPLRERVALLQAYSDTYLAEEIRAEALARSLTSFARFLEVAALMNGQVVNIAGLSRDAQVQRPTAQGYFDVLVDTLLGDWLPAFRERVRVKQVAQPKFYFFDPGVARAAAGRLRLPLDSAERGPLLETWILHELRAWLHDADAGGELAYFRTPAGAEVDFIWSHGRQRVAIEVKASARWRTEESASLKAFVEALPGTRAFAVYLGPVALKDGPISVLPLHSFLKALSRGDVLRS